MNDEPPQDKDRGQPSEADQPNEVQDRDSTVSGTDPSVMRGREATEGSGGTGNSPTQDANHNPEQASAQTHAISSSELSGETATKESVQSIPLTLPQGGNPAEHLTQEKLFETDTSQRRAREVAIKPPAAIPAREPVRYDTVLFSPTAARAPASDPAPDDNANPDGESPFQTSGAESPDAQAVTDPEMSGLPSSEANSSAGSQSVHEGADPALPSRDASIQQQLPRRGDWPPRATPQFQGIVQLSDPNPSATPATASSSGSAATAPPQSPGSTTTQPPLAGEKAAPLPRVIVMVSLDNAEKIVHEEMRVFSRELAIVGRQIAQEETENLMFDFRAQINALLR